MTDMKNIVNSQIYFLRLLTRYDSNIYVSLTGKSKWLDLYDVVRNPPSFPIASRSILKNEVVLENDSDDWTIVRDGSRRILELLNKWGARDCYYLSYSGNRSIHIHTFFDVSSIEIKPDVQKILEGADRDEVRKTVKSYLMRQISIGADVNVDMNLAGRHLVRLEGSTHEKTNKPCSMIDSVPNDRPESYEIRIPGPNSPPLKLWSINFLEDELNVYLKLRFAKKEKPIYGPGKLIEDPEKLIEILKPVYIKGHRHHIILALSGLLRRYSVSLSTAQGIIKQLGNKDEELPSRLYSLTQTYKANINKRLYGFPELIRIVRKEMEEGKVTREIAENVISQLETIAKGWSEHEAH